MRWSNQTKNSRAFRILVSILILLLIQFIYLQSNVRPHFVNEQIQPAVAQTVSPSISCDVSNGASFSPDALRSVNWTITGYIGMRYVLIHNNISEDFGQITTNTSFKVRQRIGIHTSWQYSGIQIYDANILITEQYVAFEIKEGFWTLNTVFLLAAGSIVSVAIATDVLMWRKLKNAKSGRDVIHPVTRSTMVFRTNSGVLETQTPEEEVEYTDISAMRIVRMWLWQSVVNDYYHKWVVREDLLSPKRFEGLEREIAKLLHCPQFRVLNRIQFLNIVSIYESERLVAIPLSPPFVLLVLFSGRITSTYLKRIQETIFEIKKDFQILTVENLPKIFDIMDARLKIHHSRIYVESTEETTQILHESQLPEIENDPEIFSDARGLSPLECQEITSLMKKLSMRQATDLIIDEVEDLSLALSKNKK